jgi:hypothetical protein
MIKLPVVAHIVAVALLSAAVGACESPLDPRSHSDPPEGTPRQLYLSDGPRITVNAEDEWIAIVVTVPDSTPHRGWWPTLAEVETDRGFRETVQLVPFACLTPNHELARYGFPLNFDWWHCDAVGLNNSSLLTEQQIQEIEELIDGQLVLHYPFSTMPGGSYDFVITQVGRNAVRTAVDLVSALSYLHWDPPAPFADSPAVFHPHAWPICYLDDRVPPPPCPPWTLRKVMAFSSSDDYGRRLPVSPGGWIRVAYTQPDGTELSMIAHLE